jgi:hypothetical protein
VIFLVGNGKDGIFHQKVDGERVSGGTGEEIEAVALRWGWVGLPRFGVYFF